MVSPKRVTCSKRSASMVGSALSAPSCVAARNRAPVLAACRRRSASTGSAGAAVAAMSNAWPPVMPRQPAAAARSRTMRTRVAASTPWAPANVSKANACSESPTRIAVASSKATWQASRPRRRSSSSMAGRSSCTSEYAWISSTATAAGKASATEPPKVTPVAQTSAGRSRLPPPNAA